MAELVRRYKLSVADVTTLKRACKESKHMTHTGSNPVLTTKKVKNYEEVFNRIFNWICYSNSNTLFTKIAK